MVGLAIVAVVVLVVVVEDADSCYCFSARSAYPQLTIFETKIKGGGGGNSYESHEAAISLRHSLTRCKEEVTGRSLRTLEMRKKVWGAMGRCFGVSYFPLSHLTKDMKRRTISLPPDFWFLNEIP